MFRQRLSTYPPNSKISEECPFSWIRVRTNRPPKSHSPPFIRIPLSESSSWMSNSPHIIWLSVWVLCWNSGVADGARLNGMSGRATWPSLVFLWMMWDLLPLGCQGAGYSFFVQRSPVRMARCKCTISVRGGGHSTSAEKSITRLANPGVCHPLWHKRGSHGTG